MFFQLTRKQQVGVQIAAVGFEVGESAASPDTKGQEVILAPDGEEHFTVTLPVVMSPQFFGWLFGLDGGITITAPQEAVDAYRTRLEQARADLG